MSKSTPLSQLNQNQAQGPSEEEKESLLVNEILNEINKDEEESENVSMNVEEAPVQEAPPQPEVQPIPPSENNLMEEAESPEESAKRMFNVDMEQPEETTMIQEFLNNLKAPIIVGALVVLFSIPQVTTTLGSLIPPREILQKFKLPVVLLMKFILSAVVYFAINMAL
tara:strand:+ start:3339 stop:3842 length:504 start_codon:yes stop_codon:yes gene_type:complete